jgi:oligopeptide transport system substrate-binding protein
MTLETGAWPPDSYLVFLVGKMRMKISILFPLFRLKYISGCALLLLVGCGPSTDAYRNIFRYNEATGIASLDPAFAKNQSIIWAVHQIYNTLVETDSNLHIVPSLARRWEISPDGLTYRFHLRTDVYFQSNEAFPGGRGRKMQAADVVYSLERIRDPRTASPGAWIFAGRLADSAGLEAADDSTFSLRLARPFHPILDLLSMPYCSVVPREAVDKYGPEFRSNPCGTGPFVLSSWEEGEDLILRRNPAYFEKDSVGHRLPYLDGVKISFFDNMATAFLMLQQGELDFVNDIDISFKDEVLNKYGELKPDWKGKIILSKHAYLNTEYLGILVDSSSALVKASPLRFLEVRQAINYGFDRRKMMRYLRNSMGKPAENGFVPEGIPGYDPNRVAGYDFEPEKARALLKKAGFPQGQGLAPIHLLTIDIYADLAAFIAKQLEELGIPVRIEVIQKGLLLEEMANSQAMFFRGSWIADYPDPENFLSVFYSRNPAPPNYTRYSNPICDKLYERSLTEGTDSIRIGLYRKMDQQVMRDAPVVPLWYDEVVHLVSPSIRGFSANALNLLELRRVSKSVSDLSMR